MAVRVFLCFCISLRFWYLSSRPRPHLYGAIKTSCVNLPLLSTLLHPFSRIADPLNSRSSYHPLYHPDPSLPIFSFCLCRLIFCFPLMVLVSSAMSVPSFYIHILQAYLSLVILYQIPISFPDLVSLHPTLLLFPNLFFALFSLPFIRTGADGDESPFLKSRLSSISKLPTVLLQTIFTSSAQVHLDLSHSQPCLFSLFKIPCLTRSFS
jgi:hypothetical protein